MEVSEGTEKMEVFEAEVLPVSEEQVAESRNTRTSHSDHRFELPRWLSHYLDIGQL